MNEWKKLAQPPKWALKEIQAGRLKGKSDINPQWRYMAMTEVFGVVGVGWKYTIDKTWTENGADNELLVFVQVSVFVKINDTWSDAIPGLGGSTLVTKEKNGMYNNDEAYKMAVTDALSTALKMLGVAADIYMGMWDGAKYREQTNTATASTSTQTDEVVTDSIWTAWMELVTRADAVKIAHKVFDRAKVKASILKETAKELREIVINAEQQAKAGE